MHVAPDDIKTNTANTLIVFKSKYFMMFVGQCQLIGITQHSTSFVRRPNGILYFANVFILLRVILQYDEKLFQYERNHLLEKCASGLVMKYCILLISLYSIENNYFLRTYDVKETVISRSPADLCNHKQHSTYFSLRIELLYNL